MMGAVRGDLALSPKLKELAMCVVAVLNGAEYEWGHHAPLFVQAWFPIEEQTTARLTYAQLRERRLTGPLQRVWQELVSRMDSAFIEYDLRYAFNSDSLIDYAPFTVEQVKDSLMALPTRAWRASLRMETARPVVVYHHGSGGFSDENAAMAETVQTMIDDLEQQGEDVGVGTKANRLKALVDLLEALKRPYPIPLVRLGGWHVVGMSQRLSQLEAKQSAYQDAEARFYSNKIENFKQLKRVLHRYVWVDHFSGAYWVQYFYSAGENAADMVDFIKNGSELGQRYGQQGQGSGKMPGFGGMLTDEQIEAIVDYVRSEL
jgi:hypothetical protein